MSENEWETLIARYATPEMRVCNCRQAYKTFRPASSQSCMRDGEWIDSWACPAGCSSAQIAARKHVAKCVLRSEADAFSEQPK